MKVLWKITQKVSVKVPIYLALGFIEICPQALAGDCKNDILQSVFTINLTVLGAWEDIHQHSISTATQNRSVLTGIINNKSIHTLSFS